LIAETLLPVFVSPWVCKTLALPLVFSKQQQAKAFIVSRKKKSWQQTSSLVQKQMLNLGVSSSHFPFHQHASKQTGAKVSKLQHTARDPLSFYQADWQNALDKIATTKLQFSEFATCISDPSSARYIT
jgi:hypothetical protein